MSESVYFFGYGMEGFFVGVFISQKSGGNVFCDVRLLDETYMAKRPWDYNNGDEIKDIEDKSLFELLFEIDIWSKYYFPVFSNKENQWYHKTEETDTDYIEALFEAVKFAYKKAIEVSQLKIY